MAKSTAIVAFVEQTTMTKKLRVSVVLRPSGFQTDNFVVQKVENSVAYQIGAELTKHAVKRMIENGVRVVILGG